VSGQHITHGTGTFPFPWSEALLAMGIRLVLLALSVILEFAQAVKITPIIQAWLRLPGKQLHKIV